MIGEDNQIVWSEGDMIDVVNGPYRGAYEIEPESVGTSYGIFATQFDDDYYHEGVNIAFYPVGLRTFDKEEKINELAANEYELNCELSPSQSYCFDNFSKNSFPMVAVTTSPEDVILNFRNLNGVMKLQLKGDTMVKSILLQGNDNEKLSGYCYVIASAAGIPRVVMAEDAYESIRLDCGEGVKLNKETAKNFYISIPPVVFEKGFKVTVTDTDGDKYVIEATAKNQVERSSILVMPEIDLADFAVESSDDEIIDFRDPVVKEILIRQGVDCNGDDEISYSEASRVTTLSFVIDDARDSYEQYDIVEFDEFQYFTGIKDVTEMFFGCDMLQSIKLPESLSEIGADAFKWCDSLRCVTIPDGVKIIGAGAFTSCNSLEHIELPESLEIIDDGAFYETNLKSIVLPESVKFIGEEAFAETSLTSINIPSNVAEIGVRALAGTKLTSIELPSSLMNLGDEVFYGCNDLMEIKVKDGNPIYYSLDGVLFNNEGVLLKYPPAKYCDYYKVPEGVTSICDYSFMDCIQLQSISLPNGIERIGTGTFYGCSKLSTFTIPESVVSVGYGTFEGCQRLNTLHLPSTLESIGNCAFDDCDELSNVYISDIAKWCCVQFGFRRNDLWEIYGYSNPLNSGADLYLNGEMVTELTIPDAITEVGNSFTGCGSIEEVILPEGVKSIRYEAFSNCFNLKSISLPSSLESIGESAFNNCNNLASVYITDLEKWCCVELDTEFDRFGFHEEGEFPNPLSKGADLYHNNEKVIDLIIPSSVKTLGNSFTGCGSIISVTIPTTTTTINDNAFEGCSNLENIYMMSETAMSIRHIGLDNRMYINVPADSHMDYLSKNSDVQNIVAYYYGKSWGLSGTFNKWGETSDIEMHEEGGYYVARNVELSSDTEFKFRLDNSWDKNYGAISSSAVVEDISNNAKSYGANIMVVKPGCYDIYLSKHYDEYFIMTSGTYPDAL